MDLREEALKSGETPAEGSWGEVKVELRAV